MAFMYAIAWTAVNLLMSNFFITYDEVCVISVCDFSAYISKLHDFQTFVGTCLTRLWFAIDEHGRVQRFTNNFTSGT